MDMKQLVLLFSVFLGSSITATNYHSVRHMATNKRAMGAAAPVGRVTIMIDKSDYELTVYDEEGWYATYPVVFGNNSLDDKKMEGDKNTPEGSFKITTKRVHEKWCRFLALDYPTKESIDKFNRRKKNGEIPANAKIGGGIGIHGVWPHEDFVIDRYKNWTLGCISMKNDDVKDLYQYINAGTSVTIRK
jgi:murein L,D-transpeptidase YafK